VKGDCVLVGKILTLDSLRPKADAVAIRYGRIAYVGAAREARRNVGPRAEVINLAGGVALPGFIEYGRGSRDGNVQNSPIGTRKRLMRWLVVLVKSFVVQAISC
jgi:hypothetical protein